MELTTKENKVVTPEDLTHSKTQAPKGILKSGGSSKSEKHVTFGETTIMGEKKSEPLMGVGESIVPPPPAPPQNERSFEDELKKTVQQRQKDRSEKGLVDKIVEGPTPRPFSGANVRNGSFEEELKKAVQQRQKDRSEKGLVDKIVEGPTPTPFSGANVRNRSFEEELKQAVGRRWQQQERKSLKDLRAEAEAKSQQQNQADQRRSQQKREEKEK